MRWTLFFLSVLSDYYRSCKAARIDLKCIGIVLIETSELKICLSVVRSKTFSNLMSSQHFNTILLLPCKRWHFVFSRKCKPTFSFHAIMHSYIIFLPICSNVCLTNCLYSPSLFCYKTPLSLVPA